MKYRINVPPHRVKRLTTVDLVIVYSQGWEGGHTEKKRLERLGEVIFDVPDKYEWVYASSVMDGDHFDVYVEYTNSVGTRRECIRPVPEKVG